MPTPSAAAHTPSPECPVANGSGPVHVRDPLAVAFAALVQTRRPAAEHLDAMTRLLSGEYVPTAQELADAEAVLAREPGCRQGALL